MIFGYLSLKFRYQTVFVSFFIVFIHCFFQFVNDSLSHAHYICYSSFFKHSAIDLIATCYPLSNTFCPGILPFLSFTLFFLRRQTIQSQKLLVLHKKMLDLFRRRRLHMQFTIYSSSSYLCTLFASPIQFVTPYHFHHSILL